MEMAPCEMKIPGHAPGVQAPLVQEGRDLALVERQPLPWAKCGQRLLLLTHKDQVRMIQVVPIISQVDYVPKYETLVDQKLPSFEQVGQCNFHNDTRSGLQSFRRALQYVEFIPIDVKLQKKRRFIAFPSQIRVQSYFPYLACRGSNHARILRRCCRVNNCTRQKMRSLGSRSNFKLTFSIRVRYCCFHEFVIKGLIILFDIRITFFDRLEEQVLVIRKRIHKFLRLMLYSNIKYRPYSYPILPKKSKRASLCRHPPVVRENVQDVECIDTGDSNGGAVPKTGIDDARSFETLWGDVLDFESRFS